MTIADIHKKWIENSEYYKSNEIGSGVHSFVKDILSSSNLFSLKESGTKKDNTFTHDNQSIESGRPDFMLYISSNIIIPVEVKKYTHIREGEKQLLRYQLANINKQYGILTDGAEWRFYRASSYKRWTIDDMLQKADEFRIFWNEYIKPDNYYLNLFTPRELFNFRISLNDAENRSIFFEDTTRLISNLKAKIRIIGVSELDFDNSIDKKNVEIAYSFLIQFVLYKVLVDNRFKKFQTEYESMLENVKDSLQSNNSFRNIVFEILHISDYISKNIYKPFENEQRQINEKLTSTLIDNPTIDDISPWLDIIVYINKYDFSNLKNEIFGFIYENYLKDLYQDENKGQYFTDPAVVNFMLEELGYNVNTIIDRGNDISIIDPSCGAGTFLYSAVDRIIEAWDNGSIEQSMHIESLVDKSIFGLDIEEFPLYLAEMSILMRLLPLIVNDQYENPIDEKLKLFKTKDSISEFLGTCISATGSDNNLFSHIEETGLGYESFMRDERDLHAMLESLQVKLGKRQRFDYVIGNPPYIGYNECCRQSIEFTNKIKDKNDNSITLGNVFGMNLHSVPNHPKKYRPNPNLYSFFIALGFALLKDNAKICYIIPQTLLTSGDLDVLRYYFSNNSTIEKIITFEGNLFVGRGLKQNKPVATSSLIFVATKKKAEQNHLVQIVNFKPYSNKRGIDFADYFEWRKRKERNIAIGI